MTGLLVVIILLVVVWRLGRWLIEGVFLMLSLLAALGLLFCAVLMMLRDYLGQAWEGN